MIQELLHQGLPLANRVTERACLFFAEHVYTSKGRSSLSVFANELPPQGSLENTLPKSLKQPAAGITASVMSEPLHLLLRAPFHLWFSCVCAPALPFPFHKPPAAISHVHCMMCGLSENRVAADHRDH